MQWIASLSRDGGVDDAATNAIADRVLDSDTQTRPLNPFCRERSPNAALWRTFEESDAGAAAKAEVVRATEVLVAGVVARAADDGDDRDKAIDIAAATLAYLRAHCRAHLRAPVRLKTIGVTVLPEEDAPGTPPLVAFVSGAHVLCACSCSENFLLSLPLCADDVRAFAAAQAHHRAVASVFIGRAVDVLRTSGEGVDDVVVGHQHRGVAADGVEPEVEARGACQPAASVESRFVSADGTVDFEVRARRKRESHSRSLSRVCGNVAHSCR